MRAIGRSQRPRGLRPRGWWGRGLNPARGMDVCLLCLYVVLSCVGRGLCDGLITRPEESYRVCVCVWSRNPKREAKGLSWTIRVCEWMMKSMASQSVYDNYVIHRTETIIITRQSETIRCNNTFIHKSFVQKCWYLLVCENTFQLLCSG
jgi:hypothetical protein